MLIHTRSLGILVVGRIIVRGAGAYLGMIQVYEIAANWGRLDIAKVAKYSCKNITCSNWPRHSNHLTRFCSLFL